MMLDSRVIFVKRSKSLSIMQYNKQIRVFKENKK